MKKLGLILVLLCLVSLISLLPLGCNRDSGTVTIVDDSGTEVSVAKDPQRIVSLGPSITEILFALDLGDRIVGVDDFSDYPEEARSLTKLGSPWPGFSVERILEQEPDLVLSSEGTIAGELRNRGVSVFVVQPRDISGILNSIRLIGDITGQAKKAKGLVDGLQERIDAIAARIATVTNRPTLFYEVDGTDPSRPYTVGSGTFQDELIRLAGGTNIAGGRSGWYQMSTEEILRADPEIIILEDYQFGVTPESIAGRPGWAALTAVKEGRVYPVEDPNLTCRYGPRIVDGLEELASIIHPELFT